jgi:mRNA interferase MazF
MKRGDLVTIALQGDYGKPRPALVIQSDLFSGHPSVVILPVTSELRDAPLFRVTIVPNEINGLSRPSDVMVDKVQTVGRDKIGSVFGRISQEELLSVNRMLAVFIGVV